MPAPKPIPRQGRSKGRWIGDCLASGRKPKIPFCPKRSIGTNGRSRRKSAQVTRTRSISGTEEDGAVRTKPGFNPGERSSGLAGREATCREACDGRPGTADHFPFFHDCRQGMGNVGTRESSFSDPEARKPKLPPGRDRRLNAGEMEKVLANTVPIFRISSALRSKRPCAGERSDPLFGRDLLL